MRRGLQVALLLGALMLAGCASSGGIAPSASPAFTPRAECERNGGWWRESMDFCEYESPESPRPSLRR